MTKRHWESHVPQQMRDNLDWFFDTHGNFPEEYFGRVVAIHNRSLLGSYETMDELKDDVSEHGLKVEDITPYWVLFHESKDVGTGDRDFAYDSEALGKVLKKDPKEIKRDLDDMSRD